MKELMTDPVVLFYALLILGFAQVIIILSYCFLKQAISKLEDDVDSVIGSDNKNWQHVELRINELVDRCNQLTSDFNQKRMSNDARIDQLDSDVRQLFASWDLLSQRNKDVLVSAFSDFMNDMPQQIQECFNRKTGIKSL